MHRLAWLIVIISLILTLVITKNIKPELVDSECYINNYSTSLNESEVEVYLMFNREVDSGYATISFYDSSNNLLETQRCFFFAFNEKVAENNSIYVNGEVDSYKIESFEFGIAFSVGLAFLNYFMLYAIPIAIAMFISSLLKGYREYDYNGKIISVYSGWYHHTLRVNGIKYDEHNTLSSFTPIKLSTTLDDGSKLEATISLSGRISLKINDKLVTK